MKTLKLFLVTFFLFFLLVNAGVYAQQPNIPHIINLQGVLRNAAGNLINGDYCFKFNIYDTCGTPQVLKWTESYADSGSKVTVRNGVFSVLLGSRTALPGDNPGNPSEKSLFEQYPSTSGVGLCIGIQVAMWTGSACLKFDPELPQVNITSVGYAYYADRAQDAISADKAKDVQCSTACVGETEVSFPWAKGVSANGAAADVNCTGCVGSTDVGTGAITGTQLADNAVNSAKIADNTIATSDLLNGAVNSLKIADNTVGTADIQDGGIGTNDVADSAITSAKVSFNYAASASKGGAATSLSCTSCVDSNAVNFNFAGGDAKGGNATGLACTAQCVNTSEIVDNNVTTGKIADGAITSAKIADYGIADIDIGNGVISGGKIATGAITTALISDGTILTADIGANQITSALIADSTIVTADIGANQITTGLIADGTIQTADIGTGQVTSTSIADGTIATGDIADSAITSAKIATGGINYDDLNTTSLNGNRTWMPCATTTLRGGIVVGTGFITPSCTQSNAATPVLSIDFPTAGSGNNGSSNQAARYDHKHDGVYLKNGDSITITHGNSLTFASDDNDSGVLSEVTGDNDEFFELRLNLTNDNDATEKFTVYLNNLTMMHAFYANGTASHASTLSLGGDLSCTNCIHTGDILDGQVTNADLAGDAITTDKIAGGAVQSSDIGSGQIGTGHLVDGAVTNAKILDGTIVTGDIADGQITSAKITDQTIAMADMGSGGCGAYQLWRRNSGNTAWECATISTNTYTAGSGITISSNVVSIDTGTVNGWYINHGGDTMNGDYQTDRMIFRATTWSDYGASYGHIINSNQSSYHALMIVGPNYGYGYSREVHVWDTLWADAALRTPIFYDSNDAGYYVDPNSSSDLYRIYARADVRSPIYYDRDDTAFYIDPNADSHFYRALYIDYPPHAAHIIFGDLHAWLGWGDKGIAMYQYNYLFPGRVDGGGWQNSWIVGSHGSYGIYINTGLRLESCLYQPPNDALATNLRSRDNCECQWMYRRASIEAGGGDWSSVGCRGGGAGYVMVYLRSDDWMVCCRPCKMSGY
jgi:hypothetical protein